MLATTKQIIETVLDGDTSTSATERSSILAALDGREPNARPKLITRKDTAEILGVCPKTIDRYVTRGLIREIRFTARRIRFDEAEIITFANQGIGAE